MSTIIGPVGREPSYVAAVWRHGTAGHRAAAAGGTKAGGWQANNRNQEREGEVSNRFKVLRFWVFRCPGWNSLSMIIAWSREEQRIVTAAIDQALRDLYPAHVLDAKWKS